MNPIHKNLAELRVLSGKTKSEMARALGVDRSTYFRIEAGTRKLLAEEARVAARYMKVSPSRLFRGLPSAAKTNAA